MKDRLFFQWFSTLCIDAFPSRFWIRIVFALLVVLFSLIACFLSRRLTVRILPKLFNFTKGHWTNEIMVHKFFQNLTFTIPGLIAYASIPWIFYDYGQLSDIIKNFIAIYLIMILVICLNDLIDSLLEIYHRYPLAKDIPLTRFMQILKIGIYGCVLLSVVGLLLNKSLFFFFSVIDSFVTMVEPETGLTRFSLGVIFIIISFAAWSICRHVALHVMPIIVVHTKNKWVDVLLRNNVFRNMTLLVPVIIFSNAIPTVFNGDVRSAEVARMVISILFVFGVVICVDALLNALLEIYRTYPLSEEIPLTGLVQVAKILLYSSGLLLFIALILNRSPLYLFSGLGAMTALLVLLFKDPILGFVAGIQLISNKMLRQGDWIEMSKYGADGDVVDISLTTVKVRNFDKTITTIPTYALISDSFKNWRGMKESGGRRIKRAIYIDMHSICFCTQQMINRFEKYSYLTEYIKKKKAVIAKNNAKRRYFPNLHLPYRRLTNIGTFRAYIHFYLRYHPMINQQMTFLIRQLSPTANGLPLEIYVFCKNDSLDVYERVQSDIFDHLLAIAPEFGLRVYQQPSGRDLAILNKTLENSRFPLCRI